MRTSTALWTFGYSWSRLVAEAHRPAEAPEVPRAGAADLRAERPGSLEPTKTGPKAGPEAGPEAGRGGTSARARRPVVMARRAPVRRGLRPAEALEGLEVPARESRAARGIRAPAGPPARRAGARLEAVADRAQASAPASRRRPHAMHAKRKNAVRSSQLVPGSAWSWKPARSHVGTPSAYPRPQRSRRASLGARCNIRRARPAVRLSFSSVSTKTAAFATNRGGQVFSGLM